MQNFEYQTPTKIIFGQGVIEKLPGIQPNPKYNPSVLEGTRLCKENGIEVILLASL